MSKTEINQKDISNQVISMGKEYKTRDGSKVEILTTSRNHKYSVVSLIEGWIIEVHLPNGKKFSEEGVSCGDLVEVTNIEEGLNKYDLVMVSCSGHNGHKWYLRFFSHYDEEFGAIVFNNGKCEGAATPWEYCRKATPQEIIANKSHLKF